MARALDDLAAIVEIAIWAIAENILRSAFSELIGAEKTLFRIKAFREE